MGNGYQNQYSESFWECLNKHIETDIAFWLHKGILLQLFVTINYVLIKLTSQRELGFISSELIQLNARLFAQSGILHPSSLVT